MILVTGGTGHTGRRFVRHLVEQGHRPRVLTRDPTKLPIELRRQVEMFRGSLDDPAEAAEAMAGVTAVVALTHIKFAPRILDAMKAAGVRRGVFMSSTRRFTRFPEETARQVTAGEEAVRASGLDWTIIRASMIYGGPEDNNLTHLVNALRRWPVHPLPGGGRMLWQPVYTWDVIAALSAALERPETIGHDYTVAGPEPVSYREMVRTILRRMGKRRLLLPVPLGGLRLAAALLARLSSRPPIRPDQIQRLEEDKTFDISDARRDLGFDPISFEEGIRRKLEGKA